MDTSRMTCEAVLPEKSQSVSFHATVLALSETGLGATLRSLHFPFSGNFLSLNQIFLLTHCMISLPKERTWLPCSVSTSAAAYTCLFPHEKILFSSGALTLQGLLYNVGILLLGNSFGGRLFGGVLASLWSLIQPFVLMVLIFGTTASSSALDAMQSFFIWLVYLKVALAMSVVIGAHYIPAGACERYFAFLAQQRQRPASKRVIVGAFCDLCTPLFLVSLFVTACSSLYLYGLCLRSLLAFVIPIVFGFTLYLLLRLLPLDSIFSKRSWLVGDIVRTMQTM
jgi:hypothetical protein